MKENTAIAVFGSHEVAEEAIKELERDGFDMKKLSIVGKDFHTEEHVMGFYNTGDRVKFWGGAGAFWGGLWGLLFGAAFLWVPGIGLVAFGGPIVAMIVGALESAVVVGGLGAIGAALYSIGIPKNSIVEYESAVKAGRFLLIVHGTAEEVRRAEELLRQNGDAQAVDAHYNDQTATADAGIF
ncbi:MAG TPA: hypothetical protein VF596_09445 [Pyrinomonadaceae bacterium]|jgi:uncharacterized membrane protein